MDTRTARAAGWFATALGLIGLGAAPVLAPVPPWLIGIGWVVMFIGVLSLGISAAAYYLPASSDSVNTSDVVSVAPQTAQERDDVEDERPNVACVNARSLIAVEYGTGYAEWNTGNVGAHMKPVPAVAAAFRNTSGVTADVVRATLEYFDGDTQIANIDYGCWLGEELNWATLDPQDTSYLILVLFDGNGAYAVDDARRDSSEYQGITLRPLPRSADGLRIRATIHVQDGNYRPLRRRGETFEVSYGERREPTVNVTSRRR